LPFGSKNFRHGEPGIVQLTSPESLASGAGAVDAPPAAPVDEKAGDQAPPEEPASPSRLSRGPSASASSPAAAGMVVPFSPASPVVAEEPFSPMSERADDLDASIRASVTPEKEKVRVERDRENSVLINPKRNIFDDSKNVEALQEKLAGNTAFNRKDYLTARQHYDRAVNLDGECANFYFNRSATCFCLKDMKQALSDAKRCVSLVPENCAALARLGFTLMKCKEFAEAEEVYSRALRLEPGSVRCKKGLERVRETRLGPSAPPVISS